MLTCNRGSIFFFSFIKVFKPEVMYGYDDFATPKVGSTFWIYAQYYTVSGRATFDYNKLIFMKYI